MLRESYSVLTNADIWYGLTDKEIKQLEDLDLSLLRIFLNTPSTVPAESIYLDLGCLNIKTIIKARRLVYLQYLVKEKKSSMLSKFFIAQWKNPAVRTNGQSR